jgi:hypothetical protein
MPVVYKKQMQTLEQFIESDYFSTRSLHFDYAMYSLTADIDRICKVLSDANIPFELVGGVAVLAHILGCERGRSFVTRDVDVLVRREDLARLVTAAEAAGYQARKIVGGYMLIRSGQAPGEAVHLIFSGERSKSTQPAPHPELNPVRIPFFALMVPVAPVADLIAMKLGSFRGKDMPHLEVLDEVGLITRDVEIELPALLRERLEQARAQFLAEKPDVE